LVGSVDRKLDGRDPEVIVGISMGGLLLPKLAEEYPDAKLIFISSAPCFKPDFLVMRVFTKLTALSFPQKIFVLVAKFSGKRGVEFVYRKINPFDGKPLHKKAYEEDLKINLKAISNYPFSKHAQILGVCGKINNTNILKKLQNPAIIFGGEDDKLMPMSEIRKLHDLLSKSKLVVTSGMHFNTFEKKNLRDLKVFLS